MTLYLVQEQSDVFVDACAADEHQQLLFISLYGRDTSVQQFMARLHQGTAQGGIDAVSLLLQTTASPALKVLVGDPKRLEKTTGRMPKTGLLGNLLHMWIFDPKLLRLDHTARVAWWVASQAQTIEPRLQRDALWNLVKELSPVPLLDTWADAVLSHLAVRNLAAPPRVGSIQTLRLEIPEEFAPWVSAGVAGGLLPAPRACQLAGVEQV